jgi:hypothetical protein
VGTASTNCSTEDTATWEKEGIGDAVGHSFLFSHIGWSIGIGAVQGPHSRLDYWAGVGTAPNAEVDLFRL